MTAPVSWVEPGSAVVEVWYPGDPYRRHGRRATVNNLTATQIVLGSGDRYRIASLVSDAASGVAQFSRPAAYNPSARVLLLSPDDPRLKDVPTP